MVVLGASLSSRNDLPHIFLVVTGRHPFPNVTKIDMLILISICLHAEDPLELGTTG